MVTVKPRYADFTTLTRRRKVSKALDLAAPIYEEAHLLFHEVWDGRPIRLLGVGVTQIEAQDAELLLFPEPEENRRDRTLAATIDRLRDRYGAGKIVRAPVLGIRKRDGSESSQPDS